MTSQRNLLGRAMSPHRLLHSLALLCAQLYCRGFGPGIETHLCFTRLPNLNWSRPLCQTGVLFTPQCTSECGSGWGRWDTPQRELRHPWQDSNRTTGIPGVGVMNSCQSSKMQKEVGRSEIEKESGGDGALGWLLRQFVVWALVLTLTMSH